MEDADWEDDSLAAVEVLVGKMGDVATVECCPVCGCVIFMVSMWYCNCVCFLNEAVTDKMCCADLFQLE